MDEERINAEYCDQDESRFFDITAAFSGERLDVLCARASGETRSYVQRLLAEECILVNGVVATKAGMKLKVGDKIELTIPEAVLTELVAEDIALNIVYQDADIVVIDKPAGMVVHPAPGNARGTLVNAVMYHVRDLSGIGGEMRPGIVHRLDKLTSGLIVIAKNDMAHRSLAQQFKEHTACRAYVAIVDGNIREDSGTVDAPIGRHRVDRKRMAVTDGGRNAITHFAVLERCGTYTLALLQLETGRTHQIRVHLAHIKHPVTGDATYGAANNKIGLHGQALHAARLALTHPRTGERMSFCAPVPQWFTAVIKKAGFEETLNIEKLIAEAMDGEE